MKKRKKKFLSNYKNYIREERGDNELFGDEDNDTWSNDKFWDQAEQEDLKRRINLKSPDKYEFEDDEEDSEDETDAILWNTIKQNREEAQKKFEDDFSKSQDAAALGSEDAPFPEANFNIADPLEQEEEEEGNKLDPFEPTSQNISTSTDSDSKGVDISDTSNVEKNEDLENLCYLIRSLFKKNDIDSDAEYAGMDIKVYVYPEKKEKMPNLLKIFGVINQLKNELLVKYDADIELYQNKAHSPVFLINFDFLEDDEDIEEDEIDSLQKKVELLQKKVDATVEDTASVGAEQTKPIGLGRTANMPENDFIGEEDLISNPYGKLSGVPISQGTKFTGPISNYSPNWDAHSESRKKS